MTQTLRHRGPDGAGVKVFSDGRQRAAVALGHRRLSIIDLTNAGLQPMSNEDETVWLVFNGEIYNFPALRRELIAQGHRFRSNADSEVIIHLYEELGPAVVSRLNGIFAFAILDLRTSRLLLARDHIGVKPLYYRASDDGLAFGSEIKAILALGERREVDRQGIYDFFTYLFIPGERTAYQGVHQLPPAHTLTYDFAAGRAEVNRYWRLRERKEVASSSRADVKCALIEKLGTAVEGQLLSDVPLGIFLSGGVDSSALAGLASRLGNAPASYTIDFSSPDLRFYSEAAVAEETSRLLGLGHERLSVSESDPTEMLDLIEYFDQPFGNPTAYLQWLIAKKAREHITVALSGAGGDELFAGYPRYRAAQLSGFFHRIPKPLLALGRRGLELPRDDYRTMRLRRVREFIDGLDEDPVREFTNWTYYMQSKDKQALFGASWQDFEPSDEYLRGVFDESPLSGGNRLLYVDVRSFLPGNLLEYTDRMSMAVGMEVRVPLLEPEFVEYALNVPFNWKLTRRGSKTIMREAFAPLLSPTVRKGAKRGFNVPLGRWMQETLDSYFECGNTANAAEEMFGSDRGATWREEQILNPRYIEWMRLEHQSGRQDLSHELFSVIIFDVWWRKYVKQSLPITKWSADGCN